MTGENVKISYLSVILSEAKDLEANSSDGVFPLFDF